MATGPQPNSSDSTVSIGPSRFTAEFRQPLGGDTLKGFLDWDIYGTQGWNTVRLRSYWGQHKNFLSGWTWGAFGDPWIGASVEKSGTDVPFFTVYGVPEPTSTRPDIVAFYRHENQYGHLHAATIFRSVGGFIPDTTIPTSDAILRGMALPFRAHRDLAAARQHRIPRHWWQGNRELLPRQLRFRLRRRF